MKNIAIKENHLYTKTYKKGNCFVGRLVAIYVLRDYKAETLMRQNPEKKYLNRIGLAVSKKLGGAVVRNRAKRIIRAGFDPVKNELKQGHLIVISARGAIVGKKSTDLERELRYGFAKLGMLCKDITAESRSKKEN